MNLEDIQRAHETINDLVPPTPLQRSIYLSEKFGRNIMLKLENLNITGSFKIRGATNFLRTADPQALKHGVVAASAGNHAQAVAYVCRELGISAKIFMPEFTPMIKSESTKHLGASIELVGDTLDESYEHARTFQERHGALMIHPFAHPAVIAGQGTIGLEIHQQAGPIDAVIVPIGGGGMMSGTSCALKALQPQCKVIGVQAAAFPAMYESIKQNQVVHLKRGATIADGIAVKAVDPLNFGLIQKYVDHILLVDEEAIAASVMELIERNHLLAEGAGAASVAALEQALDKVLDPKDKNIVCVIGGGNIDINLMRRITMKGLIQSGRVMKLRARISDRPGGLAGLLKLIAQSRASIIELYHDREFNQVHYQEVEVRLNLETSGFDHQDQIRKLLQENTIHCY